MKKIITLTLAITLVTTKLIAQNITKQEKGYFNLTELGYSFGNKATDYQINANSFATSSSNAYSLSLRNINGIFVTNKISVGAGIGLENYSQDDYGYNNHNLLLLFADVRYYFRNQGNTFFAYGDAGAAAKIADDFHKGAMFNLGMGYKFKVAKSVGMTGSLGYNDQTITDVSMEHTRYYGFALRIGLLF